MVETTNKIVTVLIVEDSPTQAMRLESVLSEHGLTTIWASDGLEGLKTAQDLLPDIISILSFQD